MEVKKKACGFRAIERKVEGRTDPEAEAVRSARTDDGRPPLEASGLKLYGRRGAIVSTTGRAEKGDSRPS
ncbi:hypothetical protein J8F10_38160 [Gemmata sp. G18]|uniref:Uncharacterized protein n=1 Tax=Gemmata palustris TaxID=2822762 RepID=A0ABS5C513_9BACT|nr:hypothetical protein [Gemmata palustris]MBP3961079.1 hypothetical protein [Gemmata palustris]